MSVHFLRRLGLSHSVASCFPQPPPVEPSTAGSSLDYPELSAPFLFLFSTLLIHFNKLSSWLTLTVIFTHKQFWIVLFIDWFLKLEASLQCLHYYDHVWLLLTARAYRIKFPSLKVKSHDTWDIYKNISTIKIKWILMSYSPSKCLESWCIIFGLLFGL